MTTDPFTLVHNKLWDMLEAHSGFTDLVKPGNRIKFSGDARDPLKRQVSSDDLPEVRLVAAGGTPHLQMASNATTVLKRFEVQIATGDKRYDAVMFPLGWAVVRAMSPWLTALRAEIQWNGKTFVTLLEVTSVSEGTHDAERKRGIDAWTAVVAIDVTMVFTTADLYPV